MKTFASMKFLRVLTDSRKLTAEEPSYICKRSKRNLLSFGTKFAIFSVLLNIVLLSSYRLFTCVLHFLLKHSLTMKFFLTFNSTLDW